MSGIIRLSGRPFAARWRSLVLFTATAAACDPASSEEAVGEGHRSLDTYADPDDPQPEPPPPSAGSCVGQPCGAACLFPEDPRVHACNAEGECDMELEPGVENYVGAKAVCPFDELACADMTSCSGQVPSAFPLHDFSEFWSLCEKEYEVEWMIMDETQLCETGIELGCTECGSPCQLEMGSGPIEGVCRFDGICVTPTMFGDWGTLLCD